MLIQSFEMDARRAGIQEGMQAGIAQGSHQTKLETARLMKQANCELDFITQMTGLSKEEVESIS